MCLERSSLLLNTDSQYGHRADSLDITKIIYNRFIKLVNILTIEKFTIQYTNEELDKIHDCLKQLSRYLAKVGRSMEHTN